MPERVFGLGEEAEWAINLSCSCALSHPFSLGCFSLSAGGFSLLDPMDPSINPRIYSIHFSDMDARFFSGYQNLSKSLPMTFSLSLSVRESLVLVNDYLVSWVCLSLVPGTQYIWPELTLRQLCDEKVSLKTETRLRIGRKCIAHTQWILFALQCCASAIPFSFGAKIQTIVFYIFSCAKSVKMPGFRFRQEREREAGWVREESGVLPVYLRAAVKPGRDRWRLSVNSYSYHVIRV